ncbi:MAG: hypothetical protein IJL54_07945 [Prevotella sp.]|nr:hypothetical protein [Prevotella sp.]
MIAEITESVRMRIENHGLEDAMRHFDSMDLLLSRLPLWHVVKNEVETIFSERRKLEHTWDLERMGACTPHVIQEITHSQVFNGEICKSDFKGL